MKRTRWGPTVGLVVALGVWMGSSVSTNAAFIIPDDAVYIAAIPGTGSPTPAEIQAAIDGSSNDDPAITDIGDLLYKIEEDPDGNPAELGSMTSSYYTSPEPPWSSDQEYIVIANVPPNYADATVLVVKDGDLGSKIYDIRAWDGKEELWVYNVWAPATIDKTSHIEFYGAAIPEPTTIVAGVLLLLPLGASAVRVLRRRNLA